MNANGPELFEQFKEQEEKVIVNNIDKIENTTLFIINGMVYIYGLLDYY